MAIESKLRKEIVQQFADPDARRNEEWLIAWIDELVGVYDKYQIRV